MTISRASLCGLVALTFSLSACSALDDEAAPTTIGQDVLSGPTSAQTARPTTSDTDLRTIRDDLDASTATGDDLDAQTATARPTGSDDSSVMGDADRSTATGGSSQDVGETAGADESSTAPATTPEEEQLPAPSLEAADGEAAGGRLLPTVVRIGVHPAYDRVVFDLEGEGTPGYRVSYVDSAVEDGSGRILEVDGDALLQVVITGTRYPEEDESYEGGPGTYSIDAADVVEEVRLSGTFEGRTQAFVGIDDENLPFRVFTLSDPARLVVDVAHDE